MERLEDRRLLAGTSVDSSPIVADDAYVLASPSTCFLASAENGLLSNDVTASDRTLTATLIHGTSDGDVLLASDGSFSYSPNPGFVGTDYFTYRAVDSSGLESRFGLVSVQVNNATPVVSDRTYTTLHDATLSVAASNGLNPHDSDSSALIFSHISVDSAGTVSASADGSFIYIPPAGFVGWDSFTYKVSDGASESRLGTARINVTNTRPHANGGAHTIDQGGMLTVTAENGLFPNGFDNDGDPINVAWHSQPIHGSLSLFADGGYAYTPNASFSGTDQFMVRTTDGVTESSFAEIRITVRPRANVPAADRYTVAQNTVLTVQADGVLGNDQLRTLATVAGNTQPSYGTVTVQPDGAFTYTPQTGYHGADHFTYSIDNGQGTLVSTIVRIQVGNGFPLAEDDRYQTTVNEPLMVKADAGVLVNDSYRSKGDAQSIQTRGPQHGSLDLQADGSFLYTPWENYLGNDSFTYTVHDDLGSAGPAVVRINVGNARAIAKDDSYDVHIGGMLSVGDSTRVAPQGLLLNDEDADGHELFISSYSQPAHGNVVVDAKGSFTYQATPSLTPFLGIDRFTYQVSDGIEPGGIGIVNIDVRNKPPVARDDRYVVPYNRFASDPDPFVIDVDEGILANDFDPDPYDTLQINTIFTPQFGTFELVANGGFAYEPNEGFVGEDRFAYFLSDGYQTSEVATVTFTIEAEAPTAIFDSYSLPANTKLEVRPGNASRLEDSEDGGGDSYADGEDLDEERGSGPVTQSILENDTIAEHSRPEATLQIVRMPTHGTATLQQDENGQFTGGFDYEPDAGFIGIDSFSYQFGDANLPSNVATIRLAVTHTPPRAVDDHYTFDTGFVGYGGPPRPLPHKVGVGEGLLNNDTPSTTVVAGRIQTNAGGWVLLNADGSFEYTPAVDSDGSMFSGVDGFQYETIDPIGVKATGRVRLALHNRKPTARNVRYSIWAGETLDITDVASGLVRYDNQTDYDGAEDPDGDGLQVVEPGEIEAPPHQLSVQADGTFQFIPDPTFAGWVDIEFRVTDGASLSEPANARIFVGNVSPEAYKYSTRFANGDDVEGMTGTIDLGGQLTSESTTYSYPAGAEDYEFTHTFEADDGVAGSDTWHASDKPAGAKKIIVGSVPAAPYFALAQHDYFYQGRLGSDVEVTMTHMIEGQITGDVLENDDWAGADNCDIDGGGGAFACDANRVEFQWLTTPESSTSGTGGIWIEGPDDGTFTYQAADDWSGIDNATYRLTVYDDKNNAITNEARVRFEVFPKEPPIPADHANVVALYEGYDAITGVRGVFSAAGKLAALAGEEWGPTTPDTLEGLTWEIETEAEYGTFRFSADRLGYEYISDNYFPIWQNSDQVIIRATTPAGDVIKRKIRFAFSSPIYSAYNDFYETTHDTPLLVPWTEGVIQNDENVFLHSMRVALSGGPNHGTAKFDEGGGFLYKPDPGFVGRDSFDYLVSDGVTYEVATVTVDVTNQPGIAKDDQYSTLAGESLIIGIPDGVLSHPDARDPGDDFDPDANDLEGARAIPFGLAKGGTLELNDFGGFHYSPSPQNVGTGLFFYRFNDGADSPAGDSNLAAVSIRIQNPQPSAEGVEFALPYTEGGLMRPMHLGLQGERSTDGSTTVTPLQTQIQSTGEMTISPSGAFSYLTAGKIGRDYFAYQIHNGYRQSAAQPLVIEVTNETPVAGDDNYSAAKGETLVVSPLEGIRKNDTDDGATTASIISAPKHGALTLGDAGEFVYEPFRTGANAYVGPDAFTYRVVDEHGADSIGVVRISLTDTVPEAPDKTYSTPLNGRLTVATSDGPLQLGSDSEQSLASEDGAFRAGDSLTIVNDVQHGTLELRESGFFSYMPDDGFLGEEVFTYQALRDGTPGAIGKVTIFVEGEVPPTPVDDEYGVQHGQRLVVDRTEGLQANDEGTGVRPPQAVVVNAPSHGTLQTDPGGSFLYTPASDFVGTDLFTYRLQRDGMESAVAAVTMRVTNAAPHVQNESFDLVHDRTLFVSNTENLLANDSDEDGDRLSIELVDRPLFGSLVWNDTGSFSYTPNEGYVGPDMLRYTVSDGVDVAIGTVEFDVTNAAPQIDAQIADAIINNSDSGSADGTVPEGTATGETNTEETNTDDAYSEAAYNEEAWTEETFTEEGYAEKSYAEETYAEETYAEETYAEETYAEETYPEETYPEETYAEEAYAEEAYQEEAYAEEAFTEEAFYEEAFYEEAFYEEAFYEEAFYEEAFYEEAFYEEAFYEEAYSEDDFAEETHPDPYEADSYGEDSYGEDSYGEDSYGEDSYGEDSYGEDPYGEESFGEESFGEESFGEESFGEDSYGEDSYGEDPYGEESFGEDSYGEVSFGEDPNGGDASNGSIWNPPRTGPSCSSSPSTYDAEAAATDPFHFYVDYVTHARVFNQDANWFVATDTNLEQVWESYLIVPAQRGMLQHAADADGDMISADVLNEPADGSLRWSDAGAFQYTPDEGFAGPDGFTFRLTDGINPSPVYTIHINVAASVPTAGCHSYSVLRDETLLVPITRGVLRYADDRQHDLVLAEEIAPPAHGTLNFSSEGSFRYTPDAGFVGFDTFGYRLRDARHYGEAQRVVIQVTETGVEEDLSAAPDTYATSHSERLIVHGLGVLENDGVTLPSTVAVRLEDDVTNGTLILYDGGTFRYQADRGFSGIDTFSYVVTDGFNDTPPTPVSIHVTDSAATAVDDSYTTHFSTDLLIPAGEGVLSNDTDPEGDLFKAEIVSEPELGSLNLLETGAFQYYPPSHFVGTVSFVYQIDGGSQATATISVTNDAPTLSSQSYSTRHRSPLSVASEKGILSTFHDANGDPLKRWSLVDTVDHGQLDLFYNGAMIYTPDDGFEGNDSFSVKVYDGGLWSSPVVVNLTVTNATVHAIDKSYSMGHDRVLNVDAAEGLLPEMFDEDEDALSLTVESDVSHGKLLVHANGSFSYTPNEGYVGGDTFSYAVSDRYSDTPAAQVTIQVTNDSPDIAPASYATLHGRQLLVAASEGILADTEDGDQDPVFLSIDTQPSYGTLTVATDGSFVYVPDDETFVGTDTFVATVTDGLDSNGDGFPESASASYTISIGNAAPPAADHQYSLGRQQMLLVVDDERHRQFFDGVISQDTLPKIDSDGDFLTYSLGPLATNSVSGNLSFEESGVFSYTSPENFVGTAVFPYHVTDGIATATGSLAFHVQNTAPVASDDIYQYGAGNAPVSDAAFSEGSSAVTPAKSELNVLARGLRKEGVLANDFDADQANEPRLIAQLVGGTGATVITDTTAGPQLRSVTNAAGDALGELRFTEHGGFFFKAAEGLHQDVTFQYRAFDGAAYSEPANVTIQVRNAVPNPQSDEFYVAAGETLTVDREIGLLVNDYDPEWDEFEIVSDTSSAISISGDGTFSFAAPDVAYSETVAFQYTVNDGNSGLPSPPAAVTIHIIGTGSSSNHYASANSLFVAQKKQAGIVRDRLAMAAEKEKRSLLALRRNEEYEGDDTGGLYEAARAMEQVAREAAQSILAAQRLSIAQLAGDLLSQENARLLTERGAAEAAEVGTQLAERNRVLSQFPTIAQTMAAQAASSWDHRDQLDAAAASELVAVSAADMAANDAFVRFNSGLELRLILADRDYYFAVDAAQETMRVATEDASDAYQQTVSEAAIERDQEIMAAAHALEGDIGVATDQRDDNLAVAMSEFQSITAEAASFREVDLANAREIYDRQIAFVQSAYGASQPADDEAFRLSEDSRYMNEVAAATERYHLATATSMELALEWTLGARAALKSAFDVAYQNYENKVEIVRNAYRAARDSAIAGYDTTVAAALAAQTGAVKSAEDAFETTTRAAHEQFLLANATINSTQDAGTRSAQSQLANEVDAAWQAWSADMYTALSDQENSLATAADQLHTSAHTALDAFFASSAEANTTFGNTLALTSREYARTAQAVAQQTAAEAATMLGSFDTKVWNQTAAHAQTRHDSLEQLKVDNWSDGNAFADYVRLVTDDMEPVITYLEHEYYGDALEANRDLLRAEVRYEQHGDRDPEGYAAVGYRAAKKDYLVDLAEANKAYISELAVRNNYLTQTIQDARKTLADDLVQNEKINIETIAESQHGLVATTAQAFARYQQQTQQTLTRQGELLMMLAAGRAESTAEAVDTWTAATSNADQTLSTSLAGAQYEYGFAKSAAQRDLDLDAASAAETFEDAVFAASTEFHQDIASVDNDAERSRLSAQVSFAATVDQAAAELRADITQADSQFASEVNTASSALLEQLNASEKQLQADVVLSDRTLIADSANAVSNFVVADTEASASRRALEAEAWDHWTFGEYNAYKLALSDWAAEEVTDAANRAAVVRTAHSRYEQLQIHAFARFINVTSREEADLYEADELAAVQFLDSVLSAYADYLDRGVVAVAQSARRNAAATESLSTAANQAFDVLLDSEATANTTRYDAQASATVSFHDQWLSDELVHLAAVLQAARIEHAAVSEATAIYEQERAEIVLAAINAALAAGLTEQQALAAVEASFVQSISAADPLFVRNLWQASQAAAASLNPVLDRATADTSDAIAEYTETVDRIATESVLFAAGFQESYKQAIAQAYRDHEVLIAEIDGKQSVAVAEAMRQERLDLEPETNDADRLTVEAVSPLHVGHVTIVGWLSDAIVTGTLQTKMEHAVTDFSFGAIDVLTGNASKNLRHWLGVEWIVDQSSWAYSAGTATGIGISLAAGFFTGGIGWALLGVEAAGGLFSYIYVGLNDPTGEYAAAGENPWLDPWNLVNLIPAGATGLGIAARLAPKGLVGVKNLFAQSDDLARATAQVDDVARRLAPKGAAARQTVGLNGPKVASNDILATPNRLQNKVSAWRNYNGDLSLAQWSKKYDQLQINASRGRWREQISRRIGLGEPGSHIYTPIGDRIPDAVSGAVLREIKNGYVAFDRLTRKQIGKDFYLQRRGYLPEWHFFGGAPSQRVMNQLQTFGIPYIIH